MKDRKGTDDKTTFPVLKFNKYIIENRILEKLQNYKVVWVGRDL